MQANIQSERLERTYGGIRGPEPCQKVIRANVFVALTPSTDRI